MFSSLNKQGGVGPLRPAPDLGKRRILVVDDDEQIRFLLSELFQHYGYEVTCCSDVEAALGELHGVASPPDLILLDMCMKGPDGTAFLKNVRQYLPEGMSRPPIIVLSVLQDKEIVDFAMQCGAADYVTKPFDPQKLFRKVEKYLKMGPEAHQ